jgi:Zn-dependent protease
LPQRWSLPLGRLFGIEIRLHITFAFVAGTFASAGLAGWLVLLFACVVAHELAHGVTARRHGGEVDEIILLPIGGISRLRNLPDDPRIEARVAAAGPLTSVALAVAFALAALASGTELFPPRLSGGSLVARLAWFNLMLGGFNLVPAFPMDGGRLLRSIIAFGHDPETATRIAASVGRVFAAGFFVLGVVVNPWLILIAVFIFVAGSREEAAALLHTRAQGWRVGDVMQPCVPWAPVPRQTTGAGPVLSPEDPLDPTGLAALEEAGWQAVPVVAGGLVVGLLGDEDVIEHLHLAERRDRPPADAHMTFGPIAEHRRCGKPQRISQFRRSHVATTAPRRHQR